MLGVHEVAGIVEELLHLRLSQSNVFPKVGELDRVHQEFSTKLVVVFEEIWRVEGWRS